MSPWLLAANYMMTRLENALDICICANNALAASERSMTGSTAEMVTVGIINRRKQLQIHTMCIHHQLWMPGEMLEKLTSQSLYIVVYMITNYLYIQRYCNADVIECFQTEQQAQQTKVHVRRNRTVSSSSAAEAASERRVWISWSLSVIRRLTKGPKCLWTSAFYNILQGLAAWRTHMFPHVSTFHPEVRTAILLAPWPT